MSSDTRVSIPLEILQLLGPASEQLGISLPGVSRFAPEIDISQPVRTLALEFGRLLSVQSIFLKGGELVTVDQTTGEQRPMRAARFVGWVEEFVAIKNFEQRNARQSLTRELASLILDQDVFLQSIRPLRGIHTMRLPVRREEGKIEFLEKGYDVKSEIFTVDTLPYPMNWTLEQAFSFLMEMCREFPWNLPELPDGAEPLRAEDSRSLAVHVSAMLGTYCAAMFPISAHRPMISYIANQPGSGKSLLATMALAPVHGEVASTQVPKDDKEMNSQLDTLARNLVPYIYFDDIGYGITSSPLNQFITSSFRRGRVMGGNSEIFQTPVLAQVLVTGNDINISDDLRRRSLIAELFLAGEVQGRSFRRVIDEQYLARPEVRTQFLAACCALVRHWLGDGETAPSLHPRPLAGFGDWTSTIGAIVMSAGFADPLSAPELTVGSAGDSSDDLRELLVKTADEATGDATFTRKELVEKARAWGLVEGVVGAPGDPEIDSKASKRFGKQLGKWRGRQLADSQGRLFQFGHKRQKAGMTYPLTFLP